MCSIRASVILSLSVGVIALQPLLAADDLTAAVTRMARVGRCGSPSFSPDGKNLAFVCDMSGIPQVWTAPSQGGWPNLVTSLEDPVTTVEWSPTSDWLALSVAPGGGMNTQIYLVRPDGTELKRYTKGGKDNNWLERWTYDGSALMISSNIRDSAAMDSYLLSVPQGEMQLVAQNPGTGLLQDLSRDNRLALNRRVKSRGSNDIYLVNISDGKELNLTPHEGPGEFSGQFSSDAHTVYLSSNKDRDLKAFAKETIPSNGEAGPIQVIAARDDAELDEFAINEQGTQAVLIWNVAGKSELSFVDLRTQQMTSGPALPTELAFAPKYSRRHATSANAQRSRCAFGRLGARGCQWSFPTDHTQSTCRCGPQRTRAPKTRAVQSRGRLAAERVVVASKAMEWARTRSAELSRRPGRGRTAQFS